MLEINGVHKAYSVGSQRVDALRGVSFTIPAGQFVSIVGPSGSGKSTLLHLIGALDTADAGTIRFQDNDISHLSESQRSEFRRHRIGFIFQFFNLLPTMSAWENVAIPKLLDGQSLHSAKAAATALLEDIGLGDRAKHRPAELSGGQMQRVAVARALIMDPPLILADEPTGNLDTKTGTAILEILAGVPTAGARDRAVVMVTHNLEAAASTDQVITLKDGLLS